MHTVISPSKDEIQRFNILIVEDQDDARELFKEILIQDEQLIVDSASDGEDALDKLSQKKYDLVLLDILMPN